MTHVSRIDLATGQVTALTSGPRFDLDFDAAATAGSQCLAGTTCIRIGSKLETRKRDSHLRSDR